tara:strand:+ start:79 stop:267 length:189 start_codon:yes stop_codon:yes gene_type:complete
MLTQNPATPVVPGTPQSANPAVQKPSFWQRADDVTGFALFMVIMVGGVVTPFALYVYGLLFR